jgi:hypothetical protein
MAAGRYNFIIEQGTTVNFEFQYLDSNSNPIDLTGYSGRMQLRPDFADNTNTVYITLSSSLNPDGTGLNFNGSGGTKPLSSGSIGVFIAACTSSMFTFDNALYDLELYSGSADCPYTIRLIQGSVNISREVTKQ